MDNESGKKFNLDDYDGGNHDTMTLTLDDGTDLVCNVLKIFSVNDKQYVALLPQKTDDASDIFLYRFIPGKTDDDIDIQNIDDDDEFDAASDAFDEWLDSEEFDELFGKSDD